LVWPPVFSRGWTEAVRLYDLGWAIATLTTQDTLHVKYLDVPSWARFLKMLEDAVADNFPPEEREEAKARILNAWSAEMFQGRDAE
jgi:hypothetical protein